MNDNVGPDWSTAPEWAQWWAIDADGQAYWHERKPRTGSSEWFGGGRWCEEGVLNEVWKETLTQRPETKDE